MDYRLSRTINCTNLSSNDITRNLINGSCKYGVIIRYEILSKIIANAS